MTKRQNTPSITKSLIPKIRGAFSGLAFVDARSLHVCWNTLLGHLDGLKRSSCHANTAGYCRENVPNRCRCSPHSHFIQHSSITGRLQEDAASTTATSVQQATSTRPSADHNIRLEQRLLCIPFFMLLSFLFLPVNEHKDTEACCCQKELHGNLNYDIQTFLNLKMSQQL